MGESADKKWIFLYCRIEKEKKFFKKSDGTEAHEIAGLRKERFEGKVDLKLLVFGKCFMVIVFVWSFINQSISKDLLRSPLSKHKTL